MSVSIKIEEQTRKVLINIDNAEQVHKAGIEKALFEVGKKNVRDTAALIKNGSRTGRVYTIKGKQHTASAPGEPPANMTGKLVGSGQYSVRNWQQMTFGETAPYAGYLEKGTRRMAARPHLMVVVHDNAGFTVDAIERNVHRELQRPQGTIKRQRGMTGL